MSRLLCMVAVLTTVVGVAQAMPLRTVSEKEALLRDLLQSKGLVDWLSNTPIPGESPSPLTTSGLICEIVQSLFPRSKTVKTKRDLKVNMIYHLCLPSVGPEDIDGIRLILSFMADDAPGNAQDDAPDGTQGGTGEDALVISNTSKKKERSFEMPSAYFQRG